MIICLSYWGWLGNNYNYDATNNFEDWILKERYFINEIRLQRNLNKIYNSFFFSKSSSVSLLDIGSKIEGLDSRLTCEGFKSRLAPRRNIREDIHPYFL
jgi:hypothetical protein